MPELTPEPNSTGGEKKTKTDHRAKPNNIAYSRF
jgi:hypothetical protein